MVTKSGPGLRTHTRGQTWAKWTAPQAACITFYDYIKIVIISFREREMKNSANTETHVKEVTPRATATVAAAIKETK